MEVSKENIMNEFDARMEHIRRICNEADLQALLKGLDRFISSVSKRLEKQSLALAPAPAPAPAPSRDAYFYLYVQRQEILSRLNVSKLSEAPVVELVCDFSRSHNRNFLSPVVCFDVGSDIFMVGDVHPYREEWPEGYKPFLDVLSIDNGESPSFLPCPPTLAPGLAAPKVDPLVVTLGGKTYVLTLHIHPGHPSFEVFHNGIWEILPPPPFVPCIDTPFPPHTLRSSYAFYAWDHKIAVCLEGKFYYCFDTETVEWIDMLNIYAESEGAPLLQCVAKYDKFLIAKPFSSEELVVYYLDADGFPHFFQNLDELQEMFADSCIEYSTNSYIIPFDADADNFCFISAGISSDNINGNFRFFLRVAVFRMTISNLDGKIKLIAVLEKHQNFPFYQVTGTDFRPYLCSAFLKRDTLNLDNLKVDQSFGRACSN